MLFSILSKSSIIKKLNTNLIVIKFVFNLYLNLDKFIVLGVNFVGDGPGSDFVLFVYIITYVSWLLLDDNNYIQVLEAMLESAELEPNVAASIKIQVLEAMLESAELEHSIVESIKDEVQDDTSSHSNID